MKRIVLVFMVVFPCVIIFPGIAGALGLEGIGGRLALVSPEGEADTTFGLGVVGDLGVILPQLPELKGEASAEYWGDSYDAVGWEWSWRSITFDGTAKYHFPIGGNIQPFAGGGLGLVISRWKSEWKTKSVWGELGIKTSNSDTELDLGAHIVGGADIPFGSNMKFTGEIKFQVSDTDTFQIVGAVVFKLK